MATYAEVQALILNDLHRTDLTSAVQTAMANAVAKLEYDRFWFNEGRASFTATATAYFQLSTVLPTILQIDELRAWEDGTVSRLDRTWHDALAGHDEVLTTGSPSHWAVHHQMLQLSPTPDATLVVEASGLLDLSVTAWCSYAPSLVRAAAEVELYGLVTHDVDGLARAAQFVELERVALQRRSPMHATGGEVEPWL